MRSTLQVGLSASEQYVVTPDLTVPNLLPNAPAFRVMPRVLATGYMIGLIEWTCIKAVRGHLDDGEQSLGVHVNLSHEAPSPIGSCVTIDVKLIELDGRSMVWEVHSYDEVATICKGTHGRAVINRAKFDARLEGREGVGE